MSSYIYQAEFQVIQDGGTGIQLNLTDGATERLSIFVDLEKEVEVFVDIEKNKVSKIILAKQHAGLLDPKDFYQYSREEVDRHFNRLKFFRKCFSVKIDNSGTIILPEGKRQIFEDFGGIGARAGISGDFDVSLSLRELRNFVSYSSGKYDEYIKRFIAAKEEKDAVLQLIGLHALREYIECVEEFNSKGKHIDFGESVSLPGSIRNFAAHGVLVKYKKQINKVKEAAQEINVKIQDIEVSNGETGIVFERQEHIRLIEKANKDYLRILSRYLEQFPRMEGGG